MRFTDPARCLNVLKRLGFVVKDWVCDVRCHAAVVHQSVCVVKYIIAKAGDALGHIAKHT